MLASTEHMHVDVGLTDDMLISSSIGSSIPHAI